MLAFQHEQIGSFGRKTYSFLNASILLLQLVILVAKHIRNMQTNIWWLLALGSHNEQRSSSGCCLSHVDQETQLFL